MKPFFYAIADIEGRPVLDEICVAEHPSELELSGLQEDQGMKIVPVYTGPQIDVLQYRLEEAKSKLRHVCEIMATLGNPGLNDVLLEMHKYLFPDRSAVRASASRQASIAPAQPADQTGPPTTPSVAGSADAPC